MTTVPTSTSNPAIVPPNAGASRRPSNSIRNEVTRRHRQRDQTPKREHHHSLNAASVMRCALSPNARHGRIRSKTTSGRTSTQPESFRASTIASEQRKYRNDRTCRDEHRRVRLQIKIDVVFAQEQPIGRADRGEEWSRAKNEAARKVRASARGSRPHVPCHT